MKKKKKKKKLQGDREIMLTAVSQHGCAPAYASEELRGDCEIVLAAVSVDSIALKYAAEELKGDEELIQLVLEGPDDEVEILRVSLLSGRCCHYVMDITSESREDVLRSCAASLDLDADHVVRHGTLLCGHHEVNGIGELQERFKELTLVLT